MAFFKLLKRWTNMVLGKSSFHVEQGIGRNYSKDRIKGYYNDMTNKVSGLTELDENGIPINTTIANVIAYFPISIFQYGLGLYDIYLDTENPEYKEEFLNIARWTINNIEDNGCWKCMERLKDTAHETQSAMCQSEGVSVLLRAYVETDDIRYYEAATNAIDFMIKDTKEGGTCVYDNGNVIFQEYVSKYNLSVLNGWIFSIFGLIDYTIINKEERYKEILRKTVCSMCQLLKKYDRGIWSNYDIRGTIASPAYHDIHIRQLELLYDIFGNDEFKEYAEKWKKYQKKKINKIFAMIIKLKQKIFRNKYYDINTSLVR